MFYDNLKKACEERGTSVTGLVKKLGLGTANATYWKNGSIPNGAQLARIATELDISADYLLGLDDTPLSASAASKMNVRKIAERIEKVCRERGVAVSKMLDDCSLSGNVVYNLKKEPPSIPSLDKICTIAQYLGVSVDYLCGMDNEPYRSDFISPVKITSLAQLKSMIGEETVRKCFVEYFEQTKPEMCHNVSVNDAILWFQVRNKLAEMSGDSRLTQEKLQILLFYSQVRALSLTGKPLFPNKIMSLRHSPVIVDDIHPDPKEVSSSPNIPTEIADILEYVYQSCGQFSLWKLQEIIHNSEPFASAADLQEVDVSSADIKWPDKD